MADAQTKYKLIILYMLRKVTFPLSNSQITEFMIEKEYTDYFHIQEALNDLVDSKLIVLDQIRNTTQYEATLDWEKTLEYFSYMISNDIKAEIDAYMRENAFELRNESSTRADYRQTGNGDYAVTCTVIGKSRAGKDLLCLKIGDEPKTALMFGLPHPNEPIGTMMLEYLTENLAADEDLRHAFGYTLYERGLDQGAVYDHQLFQKFLSANRPAAGGLDFPGGL